MYSIGHQLNQRQVDCIQKVVSSYSLVCGVLHAAYYDHGLTSCPVPTLLLLLCAILSTIPGTETVIRKTITIEMSKYVFVIEMEMFLFARNVRQSLFDEMFFVPLSRVQNPGIDKCE